MAEKRMFTQKIIDSDAFLEMPTSAQALYFHLNMRADDDGFVNNPKKITRYVGAAEDDLKLLLLKRFIIGFESGVIVIKHWRMHNTLKNDRYKPTDYQDELSMLKLKDNKAYTEKDHVSGPVLDCGTKVEPEWNQNGNQLEPQNRIDKNSIDKNREEKEREGLTFSNEKVCCADAQRVAEAWNTLGLSKVTKLVPGSQRSQMLNKRIKEYGVDEVLRAIENVRTSRFLNGDNKKGWQVTFDWFVHPSNFSKVLDGNYADRQSNGRSDRSTNNIFLEMLKEGEP